MCFVIKMLQIRTWLSKVVFASMLAKYMMHGNILLQCMYLWPKSQVENSVVAMFQQKNGMVIEKYDSK